ncbi:gp436 family protein [Pseudaestuariivita sp.]|uniref:gp436 family protein n=1 Tax=Pseudaestuariivita sp. TaxID=2211669 RepID=UPI0040592F9B
MAYAAQADIETLYGAAALYVAERDGAVDVPAVARALDAASAEIDSHLAVRYDTPVYATPLLQQFAIDIALYRLAAAAELMSETLRERYEDATAHLKRIAEGKAALVLPSDDAGDGGDEGASDGGPRPIVAGGPEREFTREKMRGL